MFQVNDIVEWDVMPFHGEKLFAPVQARIIALHERWVVVLNERVATETPHQNPIGIKHFQEIRFVSRPESDDLPKAA